MGGEDGLPAPANALADYKGLGGQGLTFMAVLS